MLNVKTALMNGTRRKPTTGIWCPTLFDRLPGIVYVPSRTDTAGHTKEVMSEQGQGAELSDTTTNFSKHFLEKNYLSPFFWLPTSLQGLCLLSH